MVVGGVVVMVAGGGHCGWRLGEWRTSVVERLCVTACCGVTWTPCYVVPWLLTGQAVRHAGPLSAVVSTFKEGLSWDPSWGTPSTSTVNTKAGKALSHLEKFHLWVWQHFYTSTLCNSAAALSPAAPPSSRQVDRPLRARELQPPCREQRHR